MSITINNVSYINGYAIVDYTQSGVRYNHNEFFIGDMSSSQAIMSAIMSQLDDRLLKVA